MNLSIGIIGLPNVGKSTLFNALTKSSILAANYPFATIEPNIGIVAVPDERLDILASMYESEKITPALVKFVDIAGLVAGASKGEGLGNKFLSNIRECSALVHVVRGFKDGKVTKSYDNSNPKNDIEIITTELILADIQSIENHIPKLQKTAKSDPKINDRINYLNSLIRHLESGTTLYQLPTLNYEYLNDLNLLTAKPVIFIFNIGEDDLTNDDFKKELANLVAPSKSIFICAQMEDELKTMSSDEIKEILASYNIAETGLNSLIKTAYDILGLQSYLTAGKKEVRAWTIEKGSTAPKAAGAIHSDFEKGFIAAQIMNYNDLVEAKNEQNLKAIGKVRLEGRDYVMRPDDVVEFRFNVSK